MVTTTRFQTARSFAFGIGFALTLLLGGTFLSTRDVSLAKSVRRQRVLVVLLAVGASEVRSETARINVDRLPWSNRTFEITCLVFVYARYNSTPAWVKQDKRCEPVFLHQYDYPGFVKTLLPAMVDNYDLMTLLLDDMELPKKSELGEPDFFEVMWSRTLAFNVSISTPAVFGSWWIQQIKGPEDVIGRLVHHIEVFVTTFRPLAWRCFWELVDVEYETGGWVDNFMWKYCRKMHASRKDTFSMAVFDDMLAKHLNPTGGGHSGAQSRRAAFMQGISEQQNGWFKSRGVRLEGYQQQAAQTLYANGTVSKSMVAQGTIGSN